MSHTQEVSEVDVISINDLLKVAKNFDKIVLDSVEAGMESGRSIGVLESYNFLIREGFDEAAEALMILVYDDEDSRKRRADA